MPTMAGTGSTQSIRQAMASASPTSFNTSNAPGAPNSPKTTTGAAKSTRQARRSRTTVHASRTATSATNAVGPRPNTIRTMATGSVPLSNQRRGSSAARTPDRASPPADAAMSVSRCGSAARVVTPTRRAGAVATTDQPTLTLRTPPSNEAPGVAATAPAAAAATTTAGATSTAVDVRPSPATTPDTVARRCRRRPSLPHNMAWCQRVGTTTTRSTALPCHERPAEKLPNDPCSIPSSTRNTVPTHVARAGDLTPNPRSRRHVASTDRPATIGASPR